MVAVASLPSQPKRLNLGKTGVTSVIWRRISLQDGIFGEGSASFLIIYDLFTEEKRQELS